MEEIHNNNDESEYASNVEELLREKENRKKKIRNTVIVASASIIFPLITVYNFRQPGIVFWKLLVPFLVSMLSFGDLVSSASNWISSNEKIKNLEKKVNIQDERKNVQEISKLPKVKDKKEIVKPIKKEQKTNYNKYKLRKR